jgi:hypothetical protein
MECPVGVLALKFLPLNREGPAPTANLLTSRHRPMLRFVPNAISVRSGTRLREVPAADPLGPSIARQNVAGFGAKPLAGSFPSQ